MIFWWYKRTLELGLAERRSVAGDDDELGLARAERLEGGLVAESDLSGLCRLSVNQQFHREFPQPVRTLIVRASLALMLSLVLELFFGAILLIVSVWLGRR